MSSSNTSLNGYEFGRSPRTQTPFWGGSGEGAEIDDTAVVTDKTWSSKKISDELAEKADADDVYTKAQVDEMLADIPAVDAYTKTETDELLASKASVTSVYTKAQTYTKSEVDNLLSQIPAVDAYTKAQTDSLLADKANASEVYTKSQVDNLIPDVSGLATKTELNDGLAAKADETELANYAKVTSVYTKAQTYTKAEVDDLIEGATPAPVDAYTKAQTDSLLAAKADETELANYAKVTSVYTKAQTYTKAEVDDLIEGATPAPVDAYTKAQTDTLLADKANVTDVYTKTQTDNLLADKADETELANYAKVTSVYTKAQTYTKAEVDDLISQGGGGGAEIDDTTSASDKVWSSQKTRNSLLKAAGLTLSYGNPVTWLALIRKKTSGSATSIRNAMTEEFSADYQYSLSGGTVTVTIMYENGVSGQSYTINLTDIPWNDVPNADYSTNYPSDNSRWKTIVATEDIFEICIGGNVSESSGYYYPYIFVRVPKGTYASSISLSANLGNNKWSKAGKVSAINGYVSDPTEPIWSYDISNFVSSSLKASAIFGSTLPAQLTSHFKRDVASVQKINKIVIEARQIDLNGNNKFYKSTWNVKSLQTLLPYSTSQNMSITNFILEFVKDSGEKWVYEQPYNDTGTLYKITETIPSTSGNITGAKVADTSTTLDELLFGYSDSSWTSWSMKFCQ